MRKSQAEIGTLRHSKRSIDSSIFTKVWFVRSSASCRLPTLIAGSCRCGRSGAGRAPRRPLGRPRCARLDERRTRRSRPSRRVPLSSDPRTVALGIARQPGSGRRRRSRCASPRENGARRRPCGARRCRCRPPSRGRRPPRPRPSAALERVGGLGVDGAADDLAALEGDLDPDLARVPQPPTTSARTPCSESGWTNGDLVAAEARPRLGVDRPPRPPRQAPGRQPRRRRPRRRRGASRPPLGEEAPDRCVVAERRRRARPGPLPRAGRRPRPPGPPSARAARPRAPKSALVGVDRLVEVLDGEGDVMDRADLHAADPSGWQRAGPSRVSGSETTCGVPTRSEASDSGSTSASSSSSSGRRSVSFSSSARASEVERAAVLGEEADRILEGVVAEAGLLLVAQLLRPLGERVVVGAHRPRGDLVAHAELEHHRAGELGDALEVVGGAVGHGAEDDLLGGAAREQHLHQVEELLLRVQVAVFLRRVERVAERAAAGDDASPSARAAGCRSGAT